MAEGLHDKIGGEAQACEILEFVARHRAGGVLRADRGHLRLAISPRTHALAFRQAAGTADDLLGEREPLAAVGRFGRLAEQGRGREPQHLTGTGGEAAADDQRNAAAGTHLVEDHLGLHLELRDDRTVEVSLALVRPQFDHVAHFHLGHVEFDRQRTGVFHGVVEDRRDLGSQADAAEPLVRHIGNVLSGEPQDRVGRRLARRTGADHVAHIGDGMALRDQVLQELEGTAHTRLVRRDARPRVLEHGQGMQRNVGATPGVRRRRQVVGIGFSVDLEHRDVQRRGDFLARSEPLGFGPGAKDRLGVLAAGVRQPLHLVEGVEDQQGLLQALGRDGADLGVSEKPDERLDVEAAEHRAQEFSGAGTRDQSDFLLAFGDAGEEFGLDARGRIDARRHAVDQEIDEEFRLAGRRRAQQVEKRLRLLGRQRQRRDAERGTFGCVLLVGFEHGHGQLLR